MVAKQIVTTFTEGTRETKTVPLPVRIDKDHQELYLLNLYPEIQYQEIQYFGGAITDAVAATLEKLPVELSAEVIRSYFGADGIGYRFIRTHLDSCDFATEPYAAVEDPEDTQFNTFSLNRVENRIIYWIKEAYKAAGERLPVMLSPWSPPAFMKTNGSRIGGGRLKKEYYSAWARYICRYVREFINRGINVTAISIQNEPNATQTWDSCLFTPEEERTFLKDYLYPALKEAALSDIQIYIWDHNKERMVDRACKVIDDSTADMVSGIAFHWYSGDHFDAVRIVSELFPDKHLVFSEGCIEYSRFDTNQLRNAQMYGHDMIGNFAAGMDGFIDWNICLNEHGGPNYVGNYCEAPIICDTENKVLYDKLSFHYISHFSSYIQPKARHIATTIYSNEIEQVAFSNPDGSTVVIIMNQAKAEKPVSLRMNGNLIDSKLPPCSISTIVIE